MEDVKLCKDCRYFVGCEWSRKQQGMLWWKRATPDWFRYAKCLIKPDLVSGEAHIYCSIMREGLCGPDGKLWEPKE